MDRRNGTAAVCGAYHGRFPRLPWKPQREAASRADAILVDGRDVGQPAEQLVRVQPVSDHEAVGDLEADVATRDVDLAPIGFGQKRADLERGGSARGQAAEQVGEREARVD